MKFLIFTIFVMIAMAMVSSEKTCSPMFQLCHQSSDCCRFLQCLSYMAKCIPMGGLIVPGQDKRPLGPGPYPENVPKELLIP